MSAQMKKGENDTDSGGPRSLSRVLRLFSVLSGASDGLSLADLSEVLESPKSSLLNLLRPLVIDGFLSHANGLYRLGPAIFRLSATVLAAWDFPRMIHPFLQEISERTGETVLLGVLNRDSETMIYVDIIDSPHPIRYQIPVGTSRPLYASAAGRLLLAYSEKEFRDAYLKNVKFKVPTAVPMTRSSLKSQLEKIRAEGLCCSIDGYSKGLSAIATPVFDSEGVCIASINIAGPTERFVAELEPLKATMLDISNKVFGVVSKKNRLSLVK